MQELLNSQKCKELRAVINETDIFIKDKEESKKFNLICAIMDRFDSAIEYINKHIEKPKTETDLIVFMNFCCIIKDGINYIMKVLKMESKDDNQIFTDVYNNEPINVEKDQDYTDDAFFEYFRSLVFAHPFLTDRSIPNQIAEKEIQYSPFVIVDTYGLRREKDSIGVMVYSNKREAFSINFSFNILKDYIKWKYEMIEEITQAFRDIIKSKEEIWKKHKVNRNLKPLEILMDVKQIMKERCIETYAIEELIAYLTCKSSKKENEGNVELFKKAIIDKIPNICDCVDDYNHEDACNIVRGIIGVRPKAHQMMHYQLEKIFCYLNEYNSEHDIKWGLIQADLFSKEFAKKWVIIDVDNMKFDEIKMLTVIACYFEYQEQIVEGD